MKILVVQDWLRSGGTERQSLLLANGFAAKGHPATLLTFRPGGRLATALGPSVRHRSLQAVDLGLDWFAPGLHRAIHAEAPDVVLCMGRMANCYAGSIQRRHPNTVTIATMRTGKSLPWMFRRSLFQVRHIVANSQDARANLLAQHGVPTPKVSVIYNSLVFSRPGNETADATQRADTRAKLGASPTTRVLLNVAMFRPEKNQRELLEIVAGLPPSLDWQLWLVGDGPERGACEQLATARHLGGRVKFLGFQHDPSLLYTAADAAVHASWSEALSNFLIEAQSEGLPAIAYEAQGIRECFVPDRTGWAIRRDDRNAFRTALVRALSLLPAERTALADEAISFAHARFAPEPQIAAYLDLFSQLRSARS